MGTPHRRTVSSKVPVDLGVHIVPSNIDKIDLVRFHGTSLIDTRYLKPDIRYLETLPKLLNSEHSNGAAKGVFRAHKALRHER